MSDFTYKEITDELSNRKIILRSDGWQIPADPANSDYQAYLDQLTPAKK